MAKWTSYLPADVYDRLCSCISRKSDILPLAQARYTSFKNAPYFNEYGLSKEDALVWILELLECNSNYFDLTKEEYDGIIHEMI